jgi:hypothetical protein
MIARRGWAALIAAASEGGITPISVPLSTVNPMDLRWEDTRDILRQLESVFQSEDTDLVASIAQRGAEILTIVAERKENIQTSIRGAPRASGCYSRVLLLLFDYYVLSSCVLAICSELARQVHGESAEEDGDRLNGGLPAASRVHNAAMSRLQSGYEAVDATLDALKREEAHLREQIASVAAEDKQTALAAARLEDARNAEIPRVK